LDQAEITLEIGVLWTFLIVVEVALRMDERPVS
jgi:hypothetical protein